ncbi:hypothetical protein HF324_11895 [Chitinophaga oryzae]|uniref:Uncharacterized protein n=1 Tax=Chitinophaga oryzae TaxID=2725414 RepID=A0ABX6LER4_9BACT|nr:hypothetical protein [Chitinophaga oryzae]QJB38526.1 hypothetical protein HF324_11895 [Chitinophaga oryzae]
MTRKETQLTETDIQLLQSLGQVKGRRLRLLVFFTCVTLVFGLLLFIPSDTAGFTIGVALIFLLMFSLCYFMWRGVWLMRRRSRRSIDNGRKGIIEMQLKGVQANGRGGVDYVADNGEVYRVAVPLPGVSVLGRQLASWYPGVIEQAAGAVGERVQLHISVTGVLLRVEYPDLPAVKAPAVLTETDKRLVSESRDREKMIIIGKITEVLVPLQRGKGLHETYIRIGDTLYLLKPLRQTEHPVSPGLEVHLHVLPGRNGEADKMLYLLGA